MSDLLELATRVEAATGPDRELDGIIDRLLHDRPKDGDYCPKEKAIWRVDDGWSGLLVRSDGFARDSFCADDYTASIDAAMKLVPEGWLWAVDQQSTDEKLRHTGAKPISNWMASLIRDEDASYGREGRLPHHYLHGDAATPALALVAAALRARSSQTGSAE